MIEIDGSYGEGGGQIVRTSTALSALAGKNIVVKNIRSNRSTPGLRPQHVKGVETLAEFCEAETSGVEVGSKKITFEPGEVRAKDLEVDIGTAGSVALLLQSIMPALMQCEKKVEVKLKGGTNVKWSPPIDYLKHVLLPILRDHGYEAYVEVEKRGFYPKGGGEVTFKFHGSDLEEFNLTERGGSKNIEGVSYASEHLKDANVAERQAEAARKHLWEEFELTPEIREEHCDSRSPGSGVQLWLKTENSVIGGNALGEKGKPSEKVGKEAAKDLINNSKGAVDRYAGDQLLPFLMVSSGRIKPAQITKHCKTNQRIIEKFFDSGFELSRRTKEIKIL
ncbi:MAG: RNA 3'-terminal phosphate cyclase [Candidatus Aenigmatarchaeota archaeon]